MALCDQTNATLDEIAGYLADSDNFVICGHVSPDGDCIGSALGLAAALAQLGKTVTCVTAQNDALDPALMFLPGAKSIVPAQDFDGVCETFVCVDVPTKARIEVHAAGLLDQAKRSVTVDHHASDERMTELAYIDPDAASCSMLVWRIAQRLCADVPFETALCCYTGLVTDTGGFRYQNAGADAFSAASEMIAAGVDPSVVASNVFQNRSYASLKLDALTVERMQLICGGKAALSWITTDDMKAVDATKPDVEPLVDTLRCLRDVRIACMLREQGETVRGSLRAKDDTDVASLAREFGGGGHKAAAGFTLRMDMDSARALLLEKLEELVVKGSVE